MYIFGSAKTHEKSCFYQILILIILVPDVVSSAVSGVGHFSIVTCTKNHDFCDSSKPMKSKFNFVYPRI